MRRTKAIRMGFPRAKDDRRYQGRNTRTNMNYCTTRKVEGTQTTIQT